MAKNISFIILACIVLSWNSLVGQCNIRTSLEEIYTSQLGVKEATGNNDGKDVEKYLAKSGLTKGSPWCAAFVYWVYSEAGIVPDITAPAYCPSYFTNEYVIFKRGSNNSEFTCPPQKGDMIGIYFPSKGRVAHIAFYAGETEDYYITVEGNTNDAGSREGDKVMKKYRPKSSVYSISSFLR